MSESLSPPKWRQRVSAIVQGWSIAEPLLFSVWSMHELVSDSQTPNIRVGRGKIRIRPDFVDSLSNSELKALLQFEATRILLGHPYSRRPPRAELAYTASNLTVQEYLRGSLPIPRPRECFDDPAMDSLYFERYYRELVGRADDNSPPPNRQPGESDSNDAKLTEDGQESAEDSEESPSKGSDAKGGGSMSENAENSSENAESSSENEADDAADSAAQTAESTPSPLQQHADADQSGTTNTLDWSEDDLTRQEINAAVREAEASEGWGSIRGDFRERLVAELRPKLDYRGVLRRFRQSVLSQKRILTRMRPSRRYGFWQLGSRREFTTRVLIAIDVSGSMTPSQVRNGLSTIRPFLRQGIESLDVVFFDSQIRGGPVTIKQAPSTFEIVGRGGTDFAPLVEFVDANPNYDGVIVYTDGYASPPPRGESRKAQWLWLFDSPERHEEMAGTLSSHGLTAFLD